MKGKIIYNNLFSFFFENTLQTVNLLIELFKTHCCERYPCLATRRGAFSAFWSSKAKKGLLQTCVIFLFPELSFGNLKQSYSTFTLDFNSVLSNG